MAAAPDQTRAAVSVVYAAPRDASFLSRPDTHTPKKVHVAREDWTAACASPTSRSSRCNPLLDESQSRPAAEVPVWLRCRRPGCRVRWPA
jgi:hypothetical protein